MQNNPNHFEIFSLPEAFPVDVEELTRVYRELQRELHPDRFAGAGDHEQRLSVQYAAQVNEAYRTLRSPVRRARYLLELKGRSADAENSQLDPCFLMRQMELREDLGAVRDADDPQAALDALRDEVRKELRDIERVIAGQFRDGSEEALDKASRLVQEMQFLVKLDEEAERLEAEIFD